MHALWLGSFDGNRCRFQKTRWAPPTPCMRAKSRLMPTSPAPPPQTNFVEGLTTIAGCGEASAKSGVAIHTYAANASMVDLAMYNSGRPAHPALPRARAACPSPPRDIFIRLCPAWPSA